ncbi:methyltransferase domain-containing protein [Vararia minispora EC-137]|uniref:Methyltransferase domain-containing protein n=1 Tax=Vararia minispora EC-137 TaxID=1314806 RepID=A0ACB8QLJ5_9AGAM|nr:methyltransferase domain-containing protein [Vararia minispora EC-137]
MAFGNRSCGFSGQSLSRQALFILAPVLFFALIFLLSSPTITETYSRHFKASSPVLGDHQRYFPAPGELRSWIAEEEARYTAFLTDRRKLIEKIGPSIESFPTHGEPNLLWDLLIPTFQCPHSVRRIGDLGDGGKWVCGVEVLARQSRCIVYSFGISTDSSFEADLMTRAPGCEVWGYDFSVDGFGPQIPKDSDLARRAYFHKWGLSGKDAHGPGDNPPMYTLRTLLEMNGHDFVDVLKIDVEGSEFDVLTSFLQTLKHGETLPFGQLQIEIHAWDGHGDFANFLPWWEALEAAGFRPFFWEPNLPYVNNLRRRPDLAEYSFINIYGQNPLIID